MLQAFSHPPPSPPPLPSLPSFLLLSPFPPPPPFSIFLSFSLLLTSASRQRSADDCSEKARKNWWRDSFTRPTSWRQGNKLIEIRLHRQSVDTWVQYPTKDLSCIVQPRGWRPQRSVNIAYCFGHPRLINVKHELVQPSVTPPRPFTIIFAQCKPSKTGKGRLHDSIES